MGTKKYTSSIPWWYWVAFIDVIFLIISVMARHGVEFPQSWRLYAAFNLGIEMNLAVWWSGILLATISLLCYEFHLNKIKGFSRPWLSLSVVFLVLSIDEICSLHERMPLIYTATILAPFLLVLASYSLIVFLKDIKNQKTGVFLFFGFGLYALVLVQELIEHHVEFPTWFLGIRIAIEEGSELLATFLILFGVLKLREPVAERSFQKVIPKPLLDNSFRVFLWLGLIAHILACLLIMPGLDDIGIRGNPGIFYPMIISFILFGFLFWKTKILQGGYRVIGVVLTVLFLLTSMGSMYDLLNLIPKSRDLIPEGFVIDGFQFIYVGLIAGAIITLLISESAQRISSVLYIVLLSGIFALSFVYESLIHACLLLGMSLFVAGYFYSRLEIKDKAIQ
jgi:hypothetical protein